MSRTTHNSRGKTICVIGPTGAGKSSFANKLGNVNDDSKKAFYVAPDAESVTDVTEVKTMEWFDGDKVTLIDTPGLNDSEGRDSKHIANMVETLKKHKDVNLFAFVFHGAVARIDESMIAMISLFRDMFGPDFLDNACLVFTNWPKHKYAIKERKQSRITEENRRSEFNKCLKKLYGNTQDLPCFFIDNAYDIHDEEDAAMYHGTLRDVKALCNKLPVFECLDIKEVKTEGEKKQEELEKANQAKIDAETRAKKVQEEADARARKVQEEADARARKVQEEADARARSERAHMYALMNALSLGGGGGGSCGSSYYGGRGGGGGGRRVIWDTGPRVHTGPRGGKYIINRNGNKSYLKRR